MGPLAVDLLNPHSRAKDPSMTLKVRIIPCLDVKDGRVVKGINFVDLDRCRRPGRGRRRLRCGGRRRALLPRHHGQPREPRHDLPHRRAHGGALLHAAHRRRRRAHGGRYPQAARSRRRQGVDQHRRRVQPAVREGSVGKVRRTVHRRRHRRQESLRRGRDAALGNLHPRRPQADRHSTRSTTRGKWWRWAPAKSC